MRNLRLIVIQQNQRGDFSFLRTALEITEAAGDFSFRQTEHILTKRKTSK